MTPLLRANIVLDLLLTGWLALPGLAALFVSAVSALGVATGLHPPLPPFGAFELFMVNLAGVLGVAWNTVRLRGLWRELLVADLIAKAAVALLITGYVLFAGVTPVALLFVVSEAAGAAIEWQAARRPKA